MWSVLLLNVISDGTEAFGTIWDSPDCLAVDLECNGSPKIRDRLLGFEDVQDQKSATVLKLPP